MKYRNIAALLLLGFATAASALPFSGFNIGAQLGGSLVNLKKSTDTTTLGFGTTSNSDMVTANGMIGGIFVGYGILFNKIYFGANFEGNLANIEYKLTIHSPDKSTLSRKTKITQNSSFGPNAILGYLIQNNVLLFVTAGASWAPFKLNDDDKFSSIKTTRNRTLVGPSFGAGLAARLCNKFYLALIYKYAEYNNILYHYDFITPFYTTTIHAKYGPYNSYLKFALIYYINQ